VAESQAEKQSDKISKAVDVTKETISKTFPKDPNDFNPNGLTKRGFDTPNGRIIKWLDNTKKALFEWDQDLENGEHYHINASDGNTRIPHPITGNTHIYTGDSIPDDLIHLFK
jgi:hypothetical protein